MKRNPIMQAHLAKRHYEAFGEQTPDRPNELPPWRALAAAIVLQAVFDVGGLKSDLPNMTEGYRFLSSFETAGLLELIDIDSRAGANWLRTVDKFIFGGGF